MVSALPGFVNESADGCWACLFGAARGLAPQAQAKIEKELQSRLDESLARAIQEQEGGGAAAEVPDDVC